tara:strand:- start:5243 stop:8467 length:3225 start_codon:yes stop_codon:yes gene_type:complete
MDIHWLFLLVSMKKKEILKDDMDLKLSPSQFYRKLRPENFSDSEIVETSILPKEVLAFELEKITTNQKENQFETLARKMAEKLVAPNLIPQVGPTGGGDGKTDSETYPVSKSISDRWFIPDNGWNKDEKWAIAISAKATWKSKLKDDIKSILSTKREYTRIYFITNQTPSSKKKKDAQDEFIAEFKIDVVILDGKWVLESTYSSNLVNLVVDSLNLSSSFKNEETSLGSNDTRREKELIEIEKNISNPNRYSEYDFQLVEDAIESAILTRQLEKPRAELEGRFDRAEKLLFKIDNLGQKIRLKYQKAWTYVNYYDDYKSFLIEYTELKKLIPSYITTSSLEFYSTLFTLLRNVHLHDNKSISEDLFLKEEKEFHSFFNKISSQKIITSVSLAAKMYLCITKCFDFHNKENKLKDLFLQMKTIFIDAENRLEFPFEHFQKMTNVFGNIFVDSEEFDDLYDTIAKISEGRTSEKQAGQLYLNRAGQKMAREKYREALVYFGKAIFKLSKNESQYGFYLASVGLSQAYEQLGLFNASYSSKVAAVSILLKPWFDEGNLDPKLLELVDNLLSEEILLGRFPHILTWHELYKVIHHQFVNQNKIEGFEKLTKFDTFLCVRLLNAQIDRNTLEYLPPLLASESFWLSEDTSFFLLGHSEMILENYEKIDVKSLDELDSYYKKISNQPLNQQFKRDLNFFDMDDSSMSSNILGCEFVISFKTTNNLIVVAETILAYIEAFLGTSLKNLFPNSEEIRIELVNKENEFQVENTDKTNHYKVLWDESYQSSKDFLSISECCLNLVSKVLTNNYLIDNLEDYLTDLFKNQEVNERLSAVLNHKSFVTNVLGNSPRLAMKDWKKNSFEKVNFIRGTPFIPESVVKKKKKVDTSKVKRNKEFNDLNNIPHNKRKVISVIDNKLWDNAGWKGAGVIPTPDSVGLIIGFDKIEFGEKIFQDWIERYGIQDIDNKIKISIITHIDDENPFWYNILFSSNFQGTEMDEGSIFIASSRFHLMNATTNRNLSILKEGFRRFKKFKLYPAKVEKDLSMKISFDLSIEKTNITFIRKDEIKDTDIEYTVLMKGSI